MAATAALAVIALVSATMCSCGSVPKGRACGGADFVRRAAAARDTIFTRWFSDATSDSGYNIVTVDAAGDTLSLYLQWVTEVNPHLRIWGPTIGPDRAAGRRLWRHHRLEIQDSQEIFESAADVTTQGANTTIADIVLSPVVQTRDSIAWEQRWQFIKATGTADTVGVARTVLARRGQPYFLVRYRFTWHGETADSVRLIWSNHPRMGSGGSRHDVGFAPGVGLVVAQRVLPAAVLNYWACMLDVGNPAAETDTLAGGKPSFMASELAFQSAIGGPDYAAAFVCFNQAADIVPEEFAWMDSTGAGETSLDFASPAVSVDGTRTLDSGYRSLLARTPVLRFSPGQVRTLEYAVGRGRVGDDMPPSFPEVRWFDGSVSRCPPGPDAR